MVAELSRRRDGHVWFIAVTLVICDIRAQVQIHNVTMHEQRNSKKIVMSFCERDEHLFQHLNYKTTPTRRFILGHGTILRTRWGIDSKKYFKLNYFDFFLLILLFVVLT